MSKQPAAVLELYVIRAADGKFLRAKGYQGHGQCWVESIQDAKVYMRPGPAKAQVTWWTQNFPEYGIPEVVILEARPSGTIKHKVGLRLKKDHDRLVSQIRDFDSDIRELEESIMESDSQIVHKSLGQQVADLRHKRMLAEKQASSLATRLEKIAHVAQHEDEVE